MKDLPSEESLPAPEGQDEEANSRRLFLQSAGKWSGAAIVAAVAGVSLTSAPNAQSLDVTTQNTSFVPQDEGR